MFLAGEIKLESLKYLCFQKKNLILLFLRTLTDEHQM